MPITAGLKSLNGQWISAYHLLSAGSIMAAILPDAQAASCLEEGSPKKSGRENKR